MRLEPQQKWPPVDQLEMEYKRDELTHKHKKKVETRIPVLSMEAGTSDLAGGQSNQEFTYTNSVSTFFASLL